ncbi:MAG TPA: hypothetical protein VLW26_10280 [Steroidobacteraceae bacterium]|nr:hypothetical protein [Steroidobacteraceae bacterium]
MQAMVRSCVRGTLFGLLVTVACSSAQADVPSASAPSAASLSPDARPTLLIVSPTFQIMLVHHAHPVPVSEAEQLAEKLGLLIAGRIIRRDARESSSPLPPQWRTTDPDRGFSERLTAALDPAQANWPWRAQRVVGSSALADRALEDMKGADVVIVKFNVDLLDLDTEVQLDAEARLRIVRAAGTARDSRSQMLLRHLSVPLKAQSDHAQKSAAQFAPSGPLDQLASSAALDLSRVLAVVIERVVTPAPAGKVAGRHFGDLIRKPKCAECRPTDWVLHEEPNRVWVAPTQLAGTILSLPVP